MKLTELLSERSIKVPIEARDKEGIIRELIEILPLPGDEAFREAVFESVMAREREMTTGVGAGVAIPHGMVPLQGRSLAALGIPSAPVDFEAIDGTPVTLVFLLVVDEADPSRNVDALARVARLLRHEALRETLAASRTATEAIRAIRAAEGKTLA